MKSLIKFSLLYAGAAVLLRLIGFVISLWLAKSLSPAQYAYWGLLYSAQTGFISFALVGIVESLIGLLSTLENADSINRLFDSALYIFRLTSLVAAFVVGLISFSFLRSSSHFSIFGVVGVLLSGALLAFATLKAQIFRLQEKHSSSLYFTFLVPVVGLTSAFIAYLRIGSVDSFFYGSVVGLSCIIFFALKSNKRSLEAYPGNNFHHKLLSRITPFVLVGILGWLSGYGNNFLIEGIFGSVQVARFTFALALSSIPQLVSSSLNQVWAPRFYELIRFCPFNVVEQKNIFFYNVQCVLIGFIGFLSVIVYPYIIQAIGGNLLSYLHMRYEISLLFASYVLLVPWNHSYNYLLTYDKGSHVMNVVVVTSIVGILWWYILMKQLGPMGIYVGFLSQMFVRSIGIYLYSRRFWRLQLPWPGLVVGCIAPFVPLSLLTNPS